MASRGWHRGGLCAPSEIMCVLARERRVCLSVGRPVLRLSPKAATRLLQDCVESRSLCRSYHGQPRFVHATHASAATSKQQPSAP